MSIVMRLLGTIDFECRSTWFDYTQGWMADLRDPKMREIQYYFESELKILDTNTARSRMGCEYIRNGTNTEQNAMNSYE